MTDSSSLHSAGTDALSGPATASLDDSLAQWRELMASRPGISPDDLDELTDHLQTETVDLMSAGLSCDEAFLIAVRRIGGRDDVSDEFTRAHPDRLWRQLVLDSQPEPSSSAGTAAVDPGPRDQTSHPDHTTHLEHAGPPGDGEIHRDLILALVLGCCAGLAVRLPYGLIHGLDVESFYPRNVALIILAALGCYFLIRHWRNHSAGADRIDRVGGLSGVLTLAAGFAVPAVLVNLYPADPSSQTFRLTAIHLPIALAVTVGIAYLGDRWRSLEAWMDWVRFLGEVVLYYILVALGGGVLTVISTAIFRAIDISGPSFGRVLGWLLPVAAVAAVIVCGWLVERKKSVIENMAPVLTAVFTPLMTAALVAFLIALAVTGNPVDSDRNVLIIFDAVLIAVAAIAVFTVSARSPERPGGALDWMQLALIVVALAVDLVMLWAMAGRLVQWGPSANKIAGLGANILLLGHLAGSAWWYLRVCLARRSSPVATTTRLVRWQCAALPVFGSWALIVALVFPPLFGWS